ncbi:MAG: hypothetical protein PUP91_04365 [Rhizonema sp. PD37]|nr:hypothetical protein [Rhizonema sp. PD37]
MTTTKTSPQAKRSELPNKQRLTTPRVLRTGMCVTWGASVLLLIATISGVQKQRYAIKTVGEDSVPSIILAQRLKDSLAGMDANAVNELLVKPGQNPRAIQDYEERREVFAERIIAAAKNITYSEELQPIQKMQLAQGEYIAKIQQARDFNERGDANGMLVAYRQAAAIMDNTLLPAADKLDAVNSTELEHTYNQQRFATAQALFFVIISSLLLLSVLVGLQLFLNHRMRRILNPMLLAATAIAIIFLGYTINAFFWASYQLKVAKEDAFTSLHAIRQARALGYGINADQNRYLLDAADATKYQQAFLDKAAKIVNIPAAQTFETVAAASAQGLKVEGLTGYMALELNNITFPGEREAAVQSLSTYARYLMIDKQIRQLQQSGRHQEAIALSTGYNLGQSDWAFSEFKQANQNTFNLNQKAFDKAIAQGFIEVNGFEITTPIVVVFICVLTLFGLLPRLKEYERS